MYESVCFFSTLTTECVVNFLDFYHPCSKKCHFSVVLISISFTIVKLSFFFYSCQLLENKWWIVSHDGECPVLLNVICRKLILCPKIVLIWGKHHKYIFSKTWIMRFKPLLYLNSYYIMASIRLFNPVRAKLKENLLLY